MNWILPSPFFAIDSIPQFFLRRKRIMAVADAAGLLWFLLLCRLSCGHHSPRVPLPPRICPLHSLGDLIFPYPLNDVRPLAATEFLHTASVIEGNEVLLQKALNVIHKNEHYCVALLFYSSRCPFSGSLQPSFSLLSSIFPSIPHFAVEESAVRTSTLTRYGVHGFPSLILLNSTMRMKHQGSRALDSLISFYDEFTGIKTPADSMSFNRTKCNQQPNTSFPETCPFPCAKKSPKNLFQHETYLTLATTFLVLRMLYFTFPMLRRCAQRAWTIFTTSSLWDRPMVYLTQALQFFNSPNKPCKMSNLQEGAKNAKAWASKSLASVSFRGDAGLSSVTHAH